MKPNTILLILSLCAALLVPSLASAQSETPLDVCLDGNQKWAARADACRTAAEQGHAKAQYILGVMGESMEPTLPDGCVILIDRNRTRRREGRIFVVRTEDGLIVKYAGRAKGRWQLVSEHPSWEPMPWPTEAEMIGQAVWVARELPL